MCWVQYDCAFYYFLPKTLKSKQFGKYNLLFTPSWSSMEKNKILFVAIYKGELNLQQGWGAGGRKCRNLPKMPLVLQTLRCLWKLVEGLEICGPLLASVVLKRIIQWNLYIHTYMHTHIHTCFIYLESFQITKITNNKKFLTTYG